MLSAAHARLLIIILPARAFVPIEQPLQAHGEKPKTPCGYKRLYINIFGSNVPRYTRGCWSNDWAVPEVPDYAFVHHPPFPIIDTRSEQPRNIRSPPQQKKKKKGHIEFAKVGLSSLSLLMTSDLSTGDNESRSLEVE